MKRTLLFIFAFWSAMLPLNLSAETAKITKTTPSKTPTVTVGTKEFTESVILGGIATNLARHAGARVIERRELGGTRVLWDALRRGDIDVYAEYTGTIAREIFAGRGLKDSRKSLTSALAKDDIVLGPPLGFSDNYAFAMRTSEAKKLHIKTISDLRKHPDLAFGFSSEFMARSDGWQGIKKAYKLPQTNVRGMAHEFAYRAIAGKSIDVMDVYTTEPNIKVYHLTLLRDDRYFFPSYAAVFLWRKDLKKRAPKVVAAMQKFHNKISTEEMQKMNAAVQTGGKKDQAVAAHFLNFTVSESATQTMWSRIAHDLRQHIMLVGISLGAAIIFSIPLGIIASQHRVLGQGILAVTGMLQTIPSLALLVLMIPLLGIGAPPALLALFLYSLLPIVRNTHSGLVNIDPALIDSARALGLRRFARLRIVELPLALPSILAGVKTSAVINVGTATLAALIGAGGLGQPILTGIRLNSMSLILQGAIPSVLLALAVQGVFELMERFLVPRGMRGGKANR